MSIAMWQPKVLCASLGSNLLMRWLKPSIFGLKYISPGLSLIVVCMNRVPAILKKKNKTGIYTMLTYVQWRIANLHVSARLVEGDPTVIYHH